MPKKPRKQRKKKPNINIEQLTEEQISGLKFRDICGIATSQELEILRKLNIPSFMLKTVDASKHFPVNSGKDKRRLKKWREMIEKRRKEGTW
jgi:hypothetical protein